MRDEQIDDTGRKKKCRMREFDNMTKNDKQNARGERNELRRQKQREREKKHDRG